MAAPARHTCLRRRNALTGAAESAAGWRLTSTTQLERAVAEQAAAADPSASSFATVRMRLLRSTARVGDPSGGAGGSGSGVVTDATESVGHLVGYIDGDGGISGVGDGPMPGTVPLLLSDAALSVIGK